jgi:hypothetical protein
MFMHSFVDSTLRTSFNVSSNFYTTCKTTTKINNRTKEYCIIQCELLNTLYSSKCWKEGCKCGQGCWYTSQIRHACERFSQKASCQGQSPCCSKFQEVVNPHKVYVPHDNYLELVVNLSNPILCTRVLTFLLKQWYFTITFLWIVSFELKTSRYVNKEQSCKENVFGGTILKRWTSIVTFRIGSFRRRK